MRELYTKRERELEIERRQTETKKQRDRKIREKRDHRQIETETEMKERQIREIINFGGSGQERRWVREINKIKIYCMDSLKNE